MLARAGSADASTFFVSIRSMSAFGPASAKSPENQNPATRA
jgi:hypothetical protein